MYAIISDGGHQYRVEVGQILEVQLQDVAADAETIDFERILAVGDLDEEVKIGRPTVAGAKVSASVLGECKGPKLVIQKHRRRKHSSVKTGHRQRYLRVRIEAINC